MRPDRNIKILSAGLCAGHEKLFRPDDLKKPEYPHSFKQLYSQLENELFKVYLAIERKDKQKILTEIGAVIASASMIAELADNEKRKE